LGNIRRFLEKDAEEKIENKRGRRAHTRNEDVSEWNGLGPYRCLENVEGYDLGEHPDAKSRLCLRCREMFDSAHRGNRVCRYCHDTKDTTESSLRIINGFNKGTTHRPISEWSFINLYDIPGYNSNED